MEIVFDKTKKVLLSLVLTLLFISITTSVFAANTFKLSIASATMYEGKEIILTADEQKVTWTSSDTSKATVNNGKVTAKKAGTVTITAEKNGEKHSCEIKINKQSFIDKLRGITMNATAVTLYEGENILLNTGEIGEWKTTNKYAAIVASGRVGGKKPGIAIISQKVGRKTATCWVTVKRADKTESLAPTPTPAPVVKVQSMTLNYPYKNIKNITEITIKKDSSFTLAAEVTPSNATNKQVEWKSSNTNVATVNSSGKVTGKAKGIAIITATAKDGSGKKASCTVTVTNPVVEVNGVSLNKTSASIEKGKILTLTATVSPSDAANKEVKWTVVEGTDIISMQGAGVFKGLKKGTAKVKVESKENANIKAHCTITVTEPATPKGTDVYLTNYKPSDGNWENLGTAYAGTLLKKDKNGKVGIVHPDVYTNSKRMVCI